jgi:hypothetical protein
MSPRESRLTEAAPEIPAKASTDSLNAGTDIAQEARRRRDRIKLLLTSMTEQTNKVVAILEEAQTNEDHTALGYASWTAYVAGEYKGLLAELNRAQRRVAVGELTAAGMSTRAIAGVVGTSQKTVVKDLQVIPEVSPDHDDVDREDHVAREDDLDVALGDIQTFLGEHPVPTDRKVTGMDGKTYTVPPKPGAERRTMRQPSLPDQYLSAISQLDWAVRRLEKLHADDRFAANREALFPRNIQALVRGHDALYDMVLQLANLHSTDIAEEGDLVKPKFGELR